MSIGNRTAVLTLSRLANYGLMLISPVLLVRLLDVEAFGRYREFLLYASILQALAVFAINDSVLYCIPANAHSPWRIARQTVVLTLCTSSLVMVVLIAIDTLAHGSVVNGYLWPLVAYTMFSVNVDFWEYFWLANRQPGRLFLYSATRLTIRVSVSVSAAALTHDVRTIIWSLVTLEAIRLAGAAVAFVVYDRSRKEPPLADPWREQLHYCIPSGAATLLGMFSRNLSSLAVARMLGPISLAQYTIGRFGEPIITTVRNSISSVVLPEMVRKDRQSRESPLRLWKRATVINTIFLFPVVVIVGRYAQPLIVTVFGASYREAALVMQLYMLVVVRECFDFAPALRAINRTRPLVESNVAALATCGVALLALIPIAGVAGAMIALVIAVWVDAGWLCWRTMQAYRVGLRDILPFTSMGKTALAALTAAAFIVSPIWTELLGFAGVILGSATYLAAFALLLLLLRVPEALALLEWLKRLLPQHTTGKV